MSDRLSDLSARIREGDHEALAEYVDLQTPKLQAFLNKRMSDRLKQKIEPDDLLQELTISCLKSLEEIELGDRDPFKWLCQQAERRIIDAHRRFFGASKREASREVSFDRAGSEQAGLGDLIAASITTSTCIESATARIRYVSMKVSDTELEVNTATALRKTESEVD